MSLKSFHIDTKVKKLPNGKVSLSSSEIERFYGALRFVPDGTELKIEVTVYNEKYENERKRTEQQNKYYHKLLDIICDHTGDEHMDMHDNMKIMFLAYPWVKGDREYTVIKSTRELTSREFGAFLEKVFAWASSELGLVLPEASSFY